MVAAWTLEGMPPQHGRVHVVTGANSGLGLECAKVLAPRGATVVMACRDVKRAAAEAAAIREAHPGAALEVEPLDLADLANVRACAERVLARHARIDGLLLNAGLIAAAGTRTADGFEYTFGVCHLGHFALAARLAPALATARVVSVTSLYHTMGRIRPGDDPAHPARPSRGRAYADSKLANLLFAFELDRRARAAGLALASVAAHPGYSRTEFQKRGAAAGGSRLREALSGLSVRLFAQSAAHGALPLLRALTDTSVPGGAFLGPDGAGEVKGTRVREARAAEAARDVEAARSLWELSERVTGVRFDWARTR